MSSLTLRTRYCRKCGKLFVPDEYPFPIADTLNVCYNCYKNRKVDEDWSYEETKS